MSKRCEDVTDRLLELLYDELPADERAALQAHIAGCARCQADVASFQKTRSLARAALAEPAPAAVRQRLLAAAAAAAVAAPAATATAPAGQVAKRLVADRGGSLKGQGLWAWLRQHWTLPTLATVGAMAVFLLASRVFLNPDKTYRRGQEISAASPPPPSAPPSPKAKELRASRAEPKPEPSAGSPAPSAGSPAPPAAPPAVRRRRLSEDAIGRLTPLAGKDSAGSAGGAAGLGSIGQAPAGNARPHKMDADDTETTKSMTKKSAVAKVAGSQQMQDLRENDKPNPFPGASKGALDSLDDKSGAEAAYEERLLAKRKGSAAATPPPLADQVARRAQPAAPAAAPPPPPRPPAPVAAAAPPVVVASSPASARSSERTEEESAVPMEGLASRNAAEGGKPAAEPLPQKAERLFGLQRWAEAAAAFEQLIRQYPQSPSVPRWRQRLAVARERAGPRAGH